VEMSIIMESTVSVSSALVEYMGSVQVEIGCVISFQFRLHEVFQAVTKWEDFAGTYVAALPVLLVAAASRNRSKKRGSVQLE
jgi:hypothetical protein